MDLPEREPCLIELEAALAQVGNGIGRIALISGEAGIGKTSLIEAFTRRHIASMPVYWGTCDFLFVPRPFGPVYDMAAELHRDLPGLLSSDSQHTTVFFMVLDALKKTTAIIVFEDVHWADEATLDLLRFLGRRISQTCALLVMTYRDDELGPQHSLRVVLGDLSISRSISRSAHHILLKPLSENSVRTLVGEHAIDVHALHNRTGGNPFHITEILTNPANMKNQLMPMIDKILLRKRAIIESVVDQLKNISQIEHTRHRSPINAFINIVAGLIAYCHQPKKPSLGIIPSGLPLLAA